VIVAPADVAQTMQILQDAGETVFQMGEIRAQPAGEAPTVVV